MRMRVRKLTALLMGLSVATAISISMPGCAIGYLAQQGYFQLELLAGREPIEKAIESGGFDPTEIAQLRRIPRIKAFGRSIGLASSDNYDTINPDWKRTIWNVSACDPVAFEPKTWWFPIVGRVPYLGFFREKDASRRAERLRAKGFDVHMRTAGAYSTLGWFRDPVLPTMLSWSEYLLADTILHELAHATLWIPGSVQFNESFANFVGEEAAMRYLVHVYGADGEPIRLAQEKVEDRERFRALLHGMYEDLDGVYRDPTLNEAQKLTRKSEILATLPDRIQAVDFHQKPAYVAGSHEKDWNNARLLQFRTYNRSREQFAEVLRQENGDLGQFIARIAEVTRGANDPYAALGEATGP